jgi:hypothetical protein
MYLLVLVLLNAQHPTSITSVTLFVWVITFDLSGTEGPTINYTTASTATRII